jgi:hypothetical protein
MSVTFHIDGIAIDYEDPRTFVNVSNRTALDLLAWLAYPVGPHLAGVLDSRDLAARCRRRLWNEPRNLDPAVPKESLLGGRLITCGRQAGRLRARCHDLLRLTATADGRPVHYA